MYKLILLFILFPSIELFADYFKWEVLLSQKGFGTEIETVPVLKEGKVKFSVEDINCKLASFWTKIESDLLLESKSLICENEEKEYKVSLICRDNNKNRKYNKFKQVHPISKHGFILNPKLGSDSIYLELRCFFS